MWTRMRVFASRVLGWLRGASREQDFDTELETHLALLTDEYVRNGMTTEEAARAARVRLGGVTQLKEHQRDRRGFPVLAALAQDVRYAVRMFRRSPGFTIIAVLTVAIGVGVNTVVFTLLDAVAFKRLPVADAGNLVRLQRSFQSGARGDVQYAFSFQEYSHHRAHSQRLSSIIAAGWPEAVVAGDGGQPLQGQVVSEDYFTALGINATLGRTFLPEENRVPGRAPVIVLADEFWRRRLQGDTGVRSRSTAPSSPSSGWRRRSSSAPGIRRRFQTSGRH
jgi:hypothetical protein